MHRPILNLGAALVLLAVAGAPARAAQSDAPERVVSLSASASEEVANDWLTVVLGTQREGDDAIAVQAELKQALDAALALARPLAKPGQLELRSGNFSLSPRYRPKEQRHAGWVGQAEMVIEGRDAATVAQLAGRVQTLTISSTGWSLSRQAREKIEGEITARAIAQFREQAGVIAKAFGFDGWTLREVNVGSESPRTYRAPRALSMASRGEADAPLPTEAGRATVTVGVNGSVQLTR